MPRGRSWSSSLLALSLLLGGASLGCGTKEKEELTRRLNEQSDKLLECKKESNDLKNQVSGLKRQLATAMANPGKVTLTDPEIIELVASIRGPEEGDSGPGPDPKELSKVVMQNAQGLQQCYERALKKNAALQTRAGAQVVLGLTVKPSGGVDGVSVTPSLDAGMTDCIKQAAGRWKFSPFQGKSVVIEQKLTLTPKS